jgi:hypothetical protein
MNRLFRPSMLALLSALLALGAAALVVWPRPAAETRAMPLDEGDREIVWLYTAPSSSAWERFVRAVEKTAEQLREVYPELELVVGDRAFPKQTTAVPELTLSLRGGDGSRLVFRWYKLSSESKAQQWVQSLCDKSRRPPLAIIGGSSSDGAIELAEALRQEAQRRPSAAAPLLLLTTATAETSGEEELTAIHPNRTFRFCFTNRQMADAVTRFVWARDELRPDADVVYEVVWLDDAYSMDLTERFNAALREPLGLRAAAQEWGALTGAALTGGLAVNAAGVAAGHFTLPLAERIDYSVGGFDQPNRWELPVIRRLMDAKVERYPSQGRPLLVLTAPSSQPARRFLRGLARTAPAEARKFVVVTGDAIAFNTVCRDRDVAWPVQDLPFDLVFFCHRDPVATSAGFPGEASAPRHGSANATGTEDLLLYTDIVSAVVQAAYLGGEVAADGDELGRRLRQARWHMGHVSFGDEGPLLFDRDGNRRSGTGEHVVWLRPVVQGGRVQPEAVIMVWSWGEVGWERHRALEVAYDDVPGDR